jgi:septum formation protein
VTIRFVLASASPARRALLAAAGLQPDVIVSSVDEAALTAGLPDATTAELVQSLATAKASVVAVQVEAPALVLGCDSLLELDGQQFGKPGSAAAARERWRQMRGRSGVLHTGHCLIDVATGRTSTEPAATTVRFADITDEQIEMYCATGEPEQVAGGFTVDGLGGWFVEGIDGDHHNVVGLSLPLLRGMLAGMGYDLTDLGYPRRR